MLGRWVRQDVLYFVFSSRRRHTRCALVMEFRRVLFRSKSMALMFPRLARNFIRNGYFPTDEPTLERALSALAPSPGAMSILDPCAGEEIGRASCRERGCQYV